MSEVEHEEPVGLEEETEPPGSGNDEGGGVTFNTNWRHEAEATERAPATNGLPFDFTLQFMGIAEDLHTHPLVQDVMVGMNSPVSDFVIETIEDGLGFEVPPDLLSIYMQADGMRMTWNWKDELGTIRRGGTFQLYNFARVFGRWLDEIWLEDDTLTEDELDLIWSLRGFDGKPRDEDGFRRVTTLLLEKGHAPSLYSHLHGGGTHQLGVSPVDYLYWTLTARGMPQWQLLATDVDLEHDEEALSTTREFFTTMQKLFPEQDLGIFSLLRQGRPSTGEGE